MGCPQKSAWVVSALPLRFPYLRIEGLDENDLRAILGTIAILDDPSVDEPSDSTAALVRAACHLDNANMYRLWLGFPEIARAVWQYKNNPDAYKIMREIAGSDK